MTPGEVVMLLLCVDKWDTQLKVRNYGIFVKSHACAAPGHYCLRKMLLEFSTCKWPLHHSECLLFLDAVAFINAHFGAGTGPIHLDNVDCSGSESNLTDCQHSSTISCTNGHSQDAGVRCQG